MENLLLSGHWYTGNPAPALIGAGARCGTVAVHDTTTGYMRGRPFD